jgi:uncharacterized protein with HEPN domain
MNQLKIRDRATLLDITRSARLVLDFSQNLSQKSLAQDLKSQSAILHQLLVIGEATKRLSSDFREQNPQIPWRLIAGMRDVLIHAYDMVDLDEVWKTINKDIPELLNSVETILEE